MNTIKGSTISELEQIDDTLREMYASLQLMRVGAEAMANGETLVDVMNYVCKGLQSARAALDEVTSSVMRMRARPTLSESEHFTETEEWLFFFRL